MPPATCRGLLFFRAPARPPAGNLWRKPSAEAPARGTLETALLRGSGGGAPRSYCQPDRLSAYQPDRVSLKTPHRRPSAGSCRRPLAAPPSHRSAGAPPMGLRHINVRNGTAARKHRTAPPWGPPWKLLSDASGPYPPAGAQEGLRPLEGAAADRPGGGPVRKPSGKALAGSPGKAAPEALAEGRRRVPAERAGRASRETVERGAGRGCPEEGFREGGP